MNSTPGSAASSRPHILFLCQCLPFPPHSGVAARTFNILKQLANDFDVTLLAFSRLAHQRDGAARDAARSALSQFLNVSAVVPFSSELFALCSYTNHFRSLVSGQPFTYYEYASKEFGTQLHNAISCRRPDLIHLDSLDLYRWLNRLPNVPTFCTHHDIDSELLRRRAQRVPSRIFRDYIFYQANLIERIERILCPRFTANLTMSELDASRLATIAPASRILVVPNGVDLEYFSPSGPYTRGSGRVVFIGSSTFANRDAIEYLVGQIWPLVRGANKASSLTIIGSLLSSDRSRLENHPGVTCTGYVTDVRPHLAEAACCIVPIRVGGGTRLKILDAWAMGTPVVSTAIGCEGLAAIDGYNILVRNPPEAIAQATLQVMADNALRLSLGSNGRRTVEQEYSWDVIGRKLCNMYAEQLETTNKGLAPTPN